MTTTYKTGRKYGTAQVLEIVEVHGGFNFNDSARGIKGFVSSEYIWNPPANFPGSHIKPPAIGDGIGPVVLYFYDRGMYTGIGTGEWQACYTVELKTGTKQEIADTLKDIVVTQYEKDFQDRDWSAVLGDLIDHLECDHAGLAVPK